MPQFKTSDDIRLHYTDEGAGLPLLCLAGLTRNGRDFDYLAPHLPDDVRMIRLDYRGRGKSQWADPATYTIPTEARDVMELLAHLGLDRVAVLGTSRGGLIAMALASFAKARLIGVALNDIGPEVGREGLDTIRGYIGRPPRARTHEEAADALAAVFPEFDVPRERWLHEARLHFPPTEDGLGIDYDPALREAFLATEAGPVPDLWPLFDALDGLPLALIRGQHSKLLTAETAAKMRARRPDMIFAEVPGRGHVPFLDEPEAVAALRAWLEACR